MDSITTRTIKGILRNNGLLISFLFYLLTPAQDINAQKKNLAILLFDGVEVIDYAGPFETFSYARKNGSSYFNMYFVAKKKELTKCSVGLTVMPDYDFANSPQPDYILIPGGSVDAALNDTTTINWIRESTANARVTMSVCTGALLLGGAGLLDGKKATMTANSAYTNSLSQFGQNINVVYDRRFVWGSDKILTTAGLSSGIDGALALIEKEISKGAAQDAAICMEYHWQPELKFTRSNLAEMVFLITASMLKSLAFKGDIIKSEGNEKQWEKIIRVIEKKGIDTLSEKIQHSLISNDSWENIKKLNAASMESEFKDKRERNFHGTVYIKEEGNDSYLVTIRVRKK